MKGFIQLFILSLFLATYADEQFVSEFDDGNFEANIPKYDLILIMFHSRRCKFCRSLETELEMAAKYLSKYKIGFGKVNCSGRGKVTCRKYVTNGYPTVKLFDSGKVVEEYNGKYKAANIVEYMKNKTADYPCFSKFLQCFGFEQT